MELELLALERAEERNRQWANSWRGVEAARLGTARPASLRAWFDQALIRLSRGAAQREADRLGTKREPVL